MEILAIHDGEKVKTTPFRSEPRFGKEELKQAEEALAQETLFYWRGTKVKESNRKFAELYGVKYCVATSSGTAAVHAALGAVGIAQLDRVVSICERRNQIGDTITGAIKDLPGIYPPAVPEDCKCSYFSYLMRINEQELNTDIHTFMEALRAEGIPCYRGYVDQCIL